jgi:hypothetical protein
MMRVVPLMNRTDFLRSTIHRSLSHSRHKTDMNSLREMMPADMFQYCQEHGLLDAMLQETPAATVATATESPNKSGPADVTKGSRLAPSDYDGAQGQRPAARSSP